MQDLRQAAMALFGDQVIRERGDALDRDALAPWNDFFPIGFGGISHRSFDDAKTFGAVVGTNEEGIAVMGGVILGFKNARQKYAEIRRWADLCAGSGLQM